MFVFLGCVCLIVVLCVCVDLMFMGCWVIFGFDLLDDVLCVVYFDNVVCLVFWLYGVIERK